MTLWLLIWWTGIHSISSRCQAGNRVVSKASCPWWPAARQSLDSITHPIGGRWTHTPAHVCTRSLITAGTTSLRSQGRVSWERNIYWRKRGKLARQDHRGHDNSSKSVCRVQPQKSRVCNPWLVGPSHLRSVVVNKVLLEPSLAHVLMYCLWLFLCYSSRAEWLRQRLCGPSKRKCGKLTTFQTRLDNPALGTGVTWQGSGKPGASDGAAEEGWVSETGPSLSPERHGESDELTSERIRFMSLKDLWV